MTASPELTRREIGLLILGAALVACAMHWPIPIHLGGEIPKDLGDPLGQAWQLAWIGHAALHQPGDLFQANIYWPLDNSLAFTDVLIGYAPASVIGSGTGAAVVRYDLLFLFAYALATAGAYLLARELGVGRAGAAIAGAAFAYAPWRLGQDNHLNILSSGGIPLSIFLLLRGYRRGSPGLILAGWLVASWQLLLGVGLGLQLGYLLLVLGGLAAVYWFRHRPPLSRRVIAASAVGVAVVLLTTVFLARIYLQVRHDHPEAARTLHDVATFSPGPRAFVTVPDGSAIWSSGRQFLQQEHALFPGAVILALAFAGALVPVYPKRRRVALVAAILLLAALSLGYRPARSFPIQPYKAVFDYLPGWQAVRVPSRLHTLTTLALALLAAAGADWLIRALERRAAERNLRPRLAATAATFVIGLAILVEGSGFHLRDGGLQGPPHATIPDPPSGQSAALAPQLHLPYGNGILYVFWSAEGFPELVNGWGGFVPTSDAAFNHDSLGFPDPNSVARLRARGVRTVILHPELLRGTPWAGAAQKPVKGLPLRREVRDGVIVFHLKPI